MSGAIIHRVFVVPEFELVGERRAGKQQQWWSREEEEILRCYYGKMTVRELQEKYLPRRSIAAIYWKARMMKLTGGSNGTK